MRRLRQGSSVLVLMVLGHWLIKPLFQPSAAPFIALASTADAAQNATQSTVVSGTVAAYAGHKALAQQAQSTLASTPTRHFLASGQPAQPIPDPLPFSPGSVVAFQHGTEADQPLLHADLEETDIAPTETLMPLEAQGVLVQTGDWEAPAIKPLVKARRLPLQLSLAGGVQSIDFTQINGFQLGFRAEKSLNASLSIISGFNWNRQFFGQLEYAGEALFEAANPNLPGYAIKPGSGAVEYIRSNSFQVDLIQVPLELQYKAPRQLWKASAGLSIGLPVQIAYASGTTLQEKQLFDDRARQGLSEGIAKRFFTATLAVQVPIHDNLEMEVRGNLGLNDVSDDAYMGIHEHHANKGIQLGLIWKY